AENGEEALAAIAKQRPDLILMDIQLPVMDGYTATRRIKSDAGFEIDTDHRGHVICAQWRREESAGGRLRRLRAKTLQPAPIAGENSAIPDVIASSVHAGIQKS